MSIVYKVGMTVPEVDGDTDIEYEYFSDAGRVAAAKASAESYFKSLGLAPKWYDLEVDSADLTENERARLAINDARSDDDPDLNPVNEGLGGLINLL